MAIERHLWVSEDVQVDQMMMQVVLGNGRQGSEYAAVCAAPVSHGTTVVIYLQTEGDPRMIGVLDDGELLLSNDAIDWYDGPEMDWVRQGLSDSVVSDLYDRMSDGYDEDHIVY